MMAWGASRQGNTDLFMARLRYLCALGETFVTDAKAEAEIDAQIRASQFHPHVEWRRVPGKGRGVFARHAIAKGAVLEIAPIYAFADAEIAHLRYESSRLLQVVFTWSRDSGQERALGWGFLALYNHSHAPNIVLDDGPVPQTGQVVALRDIDAGEELCFDYGHVWFDAK